MLGLAAPNDGFQQAACDSVIIGISLLLLILPRLGAGGVAPCGLRELDLPRFRAPQTSLSDVVRGIRCARPDDFAELGLDGYRVDLETAELVLARCWVRHCGL